MAGAIKELSYAKTYKLLPISDENVLHIIENSLNEQEEKINSRSLSI